MKYKKTNQSVVLWGLMAILIVILIGCSDSSEDKKATSKNQTSTNEVKQETDDMIQALLQYTDVERDNAIKRTQEALDKLDTRIDALEKRIDSKWDTMSKAAREKVSAHRKELRRQRAEVAKWQKKLENGTADTWEDIKKGFSDAYKSLSDTWEKLENEFSTEE